MSAILLSLDHQGTPLTRNSTLPSLINPWKTCVSARATLSRSIQGRSVENFPGNRGTYLVIGLAVPTFFPHLLQQPGIVAVLSPYERCVLREYISGKSVREIAQDLNKESKSVYNALFRIREKGKQLERS